MYMGRTFIEVEPWALLDVATEMDRGRVQFQTVREEVSFYGFFLIFDSLIYCPFC